MILAWVISLLLLCASLVLQLERLTALRLIELQAIERAQHHFIAAENAVIACESNLTKLAELNQNDCFIQPVGKHIWRITSKQKPAIEIHVALDEKSGTSTRINWRQVFE